MDAKSFAEAWTRFWPLVDSGPGERSRSKANPRANGAFRAVKIDAFAAECAREAVIRNGRTMAGRPPFLFFLIDLPSDHEVDESLSTECQVIHAILANRGFRSVTKTTRMTSVDRFDKAAWRPYPKVGYVHLAAHGGRQGVGLIGGQVKWWGVAQKLKILAPRLAADQKRVLVLSCCYSSFGYTNLKPLLRNHFTGYHFLHFRLVPLTTICTATKFYLIERQQRPPSWHSRACGGAVHSIRSGTSANWSGSR